MSHILDTCFLSELFKTKKNEGALHFAKTQSTNQPHYISVISLGEIKRGILRLSPSRRKYSLQDWYDKILISHENQILPFTFEISEVWAEMTAEAEAKGKSLSPIDSLIAATALHHRLTVVTRNVSDFEHTGVRILNPWS